MIDLKFWVGLGAFFGGILCIVYWTFHDAANVWLLAGLAGLFYAYSLD